MAAGVFGRQAAELRLLQRLPAETLVEVLWLDACITRDVNVRVMPNRAFATYKRTVGRFIRIIGDHRYKQPHLVVSTEVTDEGVLRDITAIPVGIVMKVVPLVVKDEKLTYKGGGGVCVPLAAAQVKRAERLVSINGALKIVLAKDVKILGAK